MEPIHLFSIFSAVSLKLASFSLASSTVYNRTHHDFLLVGYGHASTHGKQLLLTFQICFPQVNDIEWPRGSPNKDVQAWIDWR